LTGLGSGLSGIGQQLADLFGGLIGSSADGASGPATDAALSDEFDTPDVAERADDEDASDDLDEEDPDEAAVDPEADDAEADDSEADDSEAGDAEAEGETPEEDAAAVPVDTATEAADTVEPAEPVETAEPVAPQAPAPTVAPPAVPVSPAEPVVAPAGKTPCEIAADELPQVGG
jgi:hypothetical protein